MLKILYEKGYLDYKKLILENIKTLGLSSDETLVLIKLLDLYKTNKTISISLLLDSLNISQKKLDSVLSSLMERNFYQVYISFSNGVGQEFYSLDSLFDKLEAILLNKIDNNNSNNEIFLANEIITKAFERNLTPTELEILTSLIVDENYTKEDITNALDSLKVSKKNMNMKSLVSLLSKNRNPNEKKESTESKKIVKDFLARMK